MLIQFVADKVAYALSRGLKIIACVGETLEQRESGSTMAVVAAQTQSIAGLCLFSNVWILCIFSGLFIHLFFHFPFFAFFCQWGFIIFYFLFFGCNCFGLGFSLHLLMEIGKLQTSH